MSRPEILTALTTPFADDGRVHMAAFEQQLGRLEPIVDGVFVAGTTGEFLALTQSEHEQLIATALATFGPDRVVAHVGAASVHQSVTLARQSAALGAQRFAVLTPFYLNATIEEIRRHWAAVADACSGELYGYVFPDVATSDVLPSDLPKLLDTGITGLKVSGTASERVAAYLQHAPQSFQIWSGNDADLPSVMAHGGTGTVSGVSGVCPEPWKRLSEALVQENAEVIAEAQPQIQSLVSVLGPSIARLKWGLVAQGFYGGPCRMTIDPPSQHIQDTIQETIGQALASAPQHDEGVSS